MISPERQRLLREYAEAAASANAIERRNRPTMLVLGAMVVLVAGLIVAFWGVSRSVSERQLLTFEARNLQFIEQQAEMAAQLIDDPARRELESRFSPEVALRTKLQAAADQLEITQFQPQSPRSTRFEADSPLVQTVVDVTLTNVTSRQALEWMDEVRRQIGGLQVLGVSMNPNLQSENTGWTFQIRVGRWEMDR